MNILEKNGKPIAVVLTTASALAAGVSVYTAVSAQKHSAHPVAKAAAKARTFAELSDQYYIDENEQTDWSEASDDAADEIAVQSADENTAQIPEQSVEDETIAVESDQIQPETAPVSVQPVVDADAVLDVQPLAYEQIAQPAAAPAEALVSEITPVYEQVYTVDEPAAYEAEEAEDAWTQAQAPAEAAPAAEDVAVESVEPAAEQLTAAEVQTVETPAAEEAPAAQEQVLTLDAPVMAEDASADPAFEQVAEATAEESYPAPIAEEALPNPVGEEIADTQPVVDASDPAAAAPDLSGEAVNAGAPIYDETLSSPTIDVQQPVEEVPNAQYAELNARIAEEAIKLVGTTDGLQCTEVVQMAMANAGVVDAQSLWPRLYADTYGHVTDSPEPGNLIYYNQGGDGLDHIAVYIGDDQAVHGNYDEGDGISRTVIASAQVQGCDDYSYIQVER